MSININQDKCINCKACVNACPGSLIHISDSQKAFIKYPKRCWGCASCLKVCPVQAISLYLGEDIGGLGGKLTVKSEKNFLHWIIEKPNGEIEKITINSKESNKY